MGKLADDAARTRSRDLLRFLGAAYEPGNGAHHFPVVLWLPQVPDGVLGIDLSRAAFHRARIAAIQSLSPGSSDQKGKGDDAPYANAPSAERFAPGLP